MSYTVTGELGTEIDFSPGSTVKEVLQNVRTIVTTLKGSVPLDRAFGIDSDVIDLPVQQAMARLSNEIFQAVKKYEPRAKIESISFTGEDAGRLVPLLEVSVNES